MNSSVTSPSRKTPTRPFYFNTSAHLLRISREKAENLPELLQALRHCPEESIFQHTFRTLQEHHFLREGFSNDFAQWALVDCNEPAVTDSAVPPLPLHRSVVGKEQRPRRFRRVGSLRRFRN
jgi:hypothetical protein